MVQEWQRACAWVAALSTRERVLLLLTGLLLLLLPAHSLWLEPEWLSYQKLLQREQELSQSLQLQQQANQASRSRLLDDPNQALRGELGTLEQQLQQVDQRLRQETLDLIAAERMPQVLERVLAGSGRLQLLSLTSLPPEPVLAGSKPLNLFQHGLRLQLEGSYFDVFQYLRALEGLPERFYWRSLDYQVTRYPHAQVTLELYTLSTSKEFIRG